MNSQRVVALTKATGMSRNRYGVEGIVVRPESSHSFSMVLQSPPKHNLSADRRGCVTMRQTGVPRPSLLMSRLHGRRTFVLGSAASAIGAYAGLVRSGPSASAQVAGGTLVPTSVAGQN